MDSVLPQSELLYIHATATHTATVIFLHGLGQSNVSWRLVAAEVLAPRLPHVLWIFPQAPSRPVSLNRGQPRASWFNVHRLPPDPTDFDEGGLARSAAFVENVILTQVHAGIEPARIVLAGFSQGAALAKVVALTTLHELGGVAGLSGWLPHRARDQMIHTQPNLPLFWAHGSADEDIPVEYAQEAMSFLRYRLRVCPARSCYRIYSGMKHAINDSELEDLATWLSWILN